MIPWCLWCPSCRSYSFSEARHGVECPKCSRSTLVLKPTENPMNTLLEEDPSTCADKMKLSICHLELKRKQIALEEKQFTDQGNIGVAERLARHGDNMERAIALLKGHAGMCECGPMPNDCNAAVWDLSRSVAGHTEMLRAYAGTPKGEYHARALRETQEALDAVEIFLKLKDPVPGEKTNNPSPVKHEPKHHWRTEYRCVVCEGVLSWNQVMNSSGLCPLCGFRTKDAITAVSTTKHAYREEPRPWWRFWAPKVRIYKEEK